MWEADSSQNREWVHQDTDQSQELRKFLTGKSAQALACQARDCEKVSDQAARIQKTCIQLHNDKDTQ